MHNKEQEELVKTVDTIGKMVLLLLVFTIINTVIFIPVMIKFGSVVHEIESSIQKTKNFLGN